MGMSLGMGMGMVALETRTSHMYVRTCMSTVDSDYKHTHIIYRQGHHKAGEKSKDFHDMEGYGHTYPA